MRGFLIRLLLGPTLSYWLRGLAALARKDYRLDAERHAQNGRPRERDWAMDSYDVAKKAEYLLSTEYEV